MLMEDPLLLGTHHGTRSVTVEECRGFSSIALLLLLMYW